MKSTGSCRLSENSDRQQASYRQILFMRGAKGCSEHRQAAGKKTYVPNLYAIPISKRCCITGN
jgi:hypothetical protein